MSGVDKSAPDCAGRSGAHTPGPWAAEWELSRWAFCQVSGFSTEGNRVLRCAIESFRPVEDARLIAAAPELLAALKDVLATCAPLTPKGRAYVEASRSIIAKAEGRS